MRKLLTSRNGARREYSREPEKGKVRSPDQIRTKTKAFCDSRRTIRCFLFSRSMVEYGILIQKGRCSPMKKNLLLFFRTALIALALLFVVGFAGAASRAAAAGPAGERCSAAVDAAFSRRSSADTSSGEQSEAPFHIAERDDSVSGEYSDSLGNPYTYSYSLPVLSGDTEDIAAVNAELDELFETYIAPELQNMEGGHSLVTTYASWRSAEYQGIRSLMVLLKNDWDESLYRVVSFTPEGDRVSNAELLAALGLSAEDFTAAASGKLAENLAFGSAETQSEEIRAVLEECREKTLAPENCNAELPLFVSSYGTLGFVGRIFTPAGAGQYDRFFILPPKDGFLPEELAELAREHYGAQFGQRPEDADWEENADGTVTICLYALADDPDSLCDRLTVSPETGTGVDSRNNAIDLTVL